MKSKNKQLFLIVLILLLSFVSSAFDSNIINLKNEVHAEKKEGVTLTFKEELDPEYKHYKKVVSEKKGPSIELWHYSGNRWGNSIVSIPDVSLKGNITENLEDEFMKRAGDTNGYNMANPEVPAEVRKALDEGKHVIAQIRSFDGVYSIEHFINYTDDIEKHSFVDKGSTFEFKTYPKLNYQLKSDGTEYEIGDFDLTNKIKLPFVRDRFGSNGWSIYNAGGGRPSQWASYSFWQEWINPDGNKISHQKLKKDSSGRMFPGHSISTTRGDYASETIGIGDIGNFKSGGSTSLNFWYPLEYNYYIEEEINIIEDIILTNLQLFEEGGWEPVATFKREIVD